tara:strand:+ start:1683 stop:2942 length:1260 start_codon:yes stop_codon:yes gene_type:complete
MKQAINPFSWEKLQELAKEEPNLIEGPTNPQAPLRLFGKPESTIRVTLYRDHHAWCPYCQKVWLWLEWKQIPYRVKKVTMRCYGRKENWYLKKVPSGMLPAIELDNKVITESDQILLALENIYGPLGSSLLNPQTLKLRNFERELFRVWCIWLCNPSNTQNQEERRKEQFTLLAEKMDELLKACNTPFLDPVLTNSKEYSPGSGDVIFIPYLERMNASLTYYKGLCLRENYPNIHQWFLSLEKSDVYKGTQGDFHTHAHDLPPQMGGCWIDANPKQKEFSQLIDNGKGLEEVESSDDQRESDDMATLALTRVLKHRKCILQTNPIGPLLFDQPLRSALTNMVTNTICLPTTGSALGLRYLRDRISVPRDMPLFAARKLRQALEKTAQQDSSQQGPPIPISNRFDQDPEPFLKAKGTSNT